MTGCRCDWWLEQQKFKNGTVVRYDIESYPTRMWGMIPCLPHRSSKAVEFMGTGEVSANLLRNKIWLAEYLHDKDDGGRTLPIIVKYNRMYLADA